MKKSFSLLILSIIALANMVPAVFAQATIELDLGSSNPDSLTGLVLDDGEWFEGEILNVPHNSDLSVEITNSDPAEILFLNAYGNYGDEYAEEIDPSVVLMDVEGGTHYLYIDNTGYSGQTITFDVTATATGGGTDEWSLADTLNHPNPAVYDTFRAMQLDSEQAIVTSRENSHGNVFIFKNNAGTWGYMQGTTDCVGGTTPENECITGSISTTGFDDFGQRNTISGNYAAVTAWDRAGDGDGVENTNFVYVYYWDGTSWGSESMIVPASGNESNGFGVEIAMSGDYMAIGDSEYLVNGFPAGAIYFANRTGGNTWSLGSRIVRAECEPGNLDCSNDQFGYNIGIDGNYAIVGVPNHDYDAAGNGCGGTDCGAAYIYYNNSGTWSLQEKIVSPNMASGEQFGFAVDIDGDYAIISAVGGTQSGTNAGNAYIFKRSGTDWNYVGADGLLLPKNGFAGASFGDDVAISGVYAVVGSAGQNAAYVYKRTGEVWSKDKFYNSALTGGQPFGHYVAVDGNTYYVLVNDFDGTEDIFNVYKQTPSGGGGAVPEFSDYMILMTIIIAIALMAKKLPKISGTPLTRA